MLTILQFDRLTVSVEDDIIFKQHKKVNWKL